MKNKILFSFLGVVIVSALVAVWIRDVNAVKQSENDSVLTLKISSDKQTYTLGEAVKLTFKVINESDKAVRLSFRPHVLTGYLKVWISADGQEYNRYSGNSNWGLEEGGGITLQAGKAYESQATVLWNHKIDVARLTPEAAKGTITSHYAFPTKGPYFIKAVLSIPETENSRKIESEPIQVVVEEPVGDDLEVWNSIKDNREIAYFLHNGYFLTYKDEEKEKLVEKIKQIAQRYPRSFLGGQLQQNLEKFRVEEKIRKESLEKARVKPKN